MKSEGVGVYVQCGVCVWCECMCVMWCVYVSCVVSVGVGERWTSTARGTPSSPRAPWQAGALLSSVKAELFSSELSPLCAQVSERAGRSAGSAGAEAAGG